MGVAIRLFQSRSRSLVAAGVVLTIGFTAVPTTAQILYGSVVGVVRDGTGAFIPGATVTITNKETNLTREVTTNAEGGYSVINVLPGPYNVQVKLTGFRDVARPNVDMLVLFLPKNEDRRVAPNEMAVCTFWP